MGLFHASGLVFTAALVWPGETTRMTVWEQFKGYIVIHTKNDMPIIQ